ncbi:hypothetical protein [Anoxybacillus ayderensis]|uniref:hypothetical protein n=1 Tax=Anoxybacillus ayderensis TaxID=265546 RepID=UPI0003FDFC39|nr:hypothetical protein [Anoxybacillus ayderensis]MBA2877817.1 multisubunit Na+/H+ antiporter MnhE subunit [Anoxybacillus ayderensis]MED0656574.1 hypothetical protein [Anoxybacillus ayderensis]MED0686710.1 hypothetical protein [Anoxybacillus ayderensis]OSX55223.1 hypothetical protein B7H16_02760 [Anoxybacillus ayderensis]
MYIVFLLQMIIWSLFSFIEWRSAHDHFIFKALLFGIFIYIAFLLALRLHLTKKRACWTTLLTIAVYFVCRELFWSYLL